MITLVLGGARSGKSSVAERITAALPDPITYVATIVLGADVEDSELTARVAAHRERRPDTWRTIEVGVDSDLELAEVLRSTDGTILVDSLGPWVAAHGASAVDATAICAALRERAGDAVVVSEEVGLGVHPSSEAGRLFRDSLGTLNQAVASVADETFLVVAGRTLRLEEPS